MSHANVSHCVATPDIRVGRAGSAVCEPQRLQAHRKLQDASAASAAAAAGGASAAGASSAASGAAAAAAAAASGSGEPRLLARTAAEVPSSLQPQ